MVLPSIALGSVKLTLLIFYFQLFSILRWFRLTVYIIGATEIAFYGAMTIVQFVLDTPGPHDTFAGHFISPQAQRAEQASVPISVVGLLFDLVLFAIPIPAIAHLQIQRQRKLKLLIIFGLGLL